MRKKRDVPIKSEDFIGWKSPDGKLEVIGIAGKQGTNVIYKVTCTECSKDKELFPDGYFVSKKCNLLKGSKPCGCSKQPKWEPFQYLMLACRAAKDRFIVHGFAEDFHGKNTKLNLECLKDRHKWTANIRSIINRGHGCPRCNVEQKKTPEHIALQKCIDICKEMNYDVVGFVSGYKNSTSRFEYICKIHGKQKVRYNDFVNGGTRCSGCATTGYSVVKQGTFYVYQWTKDEHSFIKFGITNQKEISRIKKQKRETKYNYEKVCLQLLEMDPFPYILKITLKTLELKLVLYPKKNFQMVLQKQHVLII